MPLTPYHFGPSGFLALAFKRRIDLPVFVLANVAVDTEVLVIALLNLGYPGHRHAHTLLVGAVVGVLWGLAAYPLRPLFARLMRLLHLPYETSLRKMVLSGILGVWLHVLIDALDHRDVRLFWPSDFALWRLVHRYVTDARIKGACVLFFPAALLLYLHCVATGKRHRDLKKAPEANT